MKRFGKSVKRLAALAAVLACAVPAPAWADDLPVSISDYPRVIRRDLPRVQPGQELRVGPVRLHPSFQTTAEYDDNIRLSESNEEEDLIFTQLPGLLGQMRLGDHKVQAGYWAEIINFSDVPEENAVNHIANANAQLNLGPVTVFINELMEESTSRLFNEDSSRDQVFLNTADVRVRYKRPQWVYEGGFKNNLVDHKPAFSDVNDRDENVGSLLVGRKVATKSTVFVEGNGGNVDYDNNAGNADQDFWQTFLGFSYRSYFEKWDEEDESVERSPNSKVNGVVKIGYQNREVDDVAGVSKSDYDGLVVDASLLYRPTLFEAVNLGYTRTVNVSTFSNNEWYRVDKVGLSYKKRLLRKLYAIPRFSWQKHSYPEQSTVAGVTDRREDDLLQFQGELRYEPRIDEETGVAWAWASLFFTVRNRDSNFDTVEFDNNKFGVKVGFSY